ncbi:MAG TPA: methyl-accepting chemotaxis protein, partial [Candidatus Aquicultor sp.]
MKSLGNMLRNFKIGNVLLIAITSMVIPVLILGFVGYSGIVSADNALDTLEQYSAAGTDYANLNYYVQRYRSNILSLVYLKDKGFVEKSVKRSADISTCIANLKKEKFDQKALEAIEKEWVAYRAASKDIVDHYTDSSYVKKQFPVMLKVERMFLDHLYDGGLGNSAQAAGVKVVDTAQARATSASVEILIATLLSLVMAGAIILLAKLFLINPLRTSSIRLMETSKKLSGSSQELAINSDGMNQTTEQITSAISQVATGAAEQSKGSADAVSIVNSIAQAISQVARSAQSQVQSVNEMATGIDGLVSSIEEVTASANEVADVVDSASSVATKGKGAVDDTVSGMERIKETVLSS